MIQTRSPPIQFARLGGVNGLKLTRSSFAVMIKFSDILEDFIALQEEVAIQANMEPDDKKDKNLIAFIKTNPQAEIIMRRFESASRMRQWINEKKQAMSNELELVVKKEIRDKRAALSMDTDTNKKADEEEKASLEKKLETLKNNVEELTQKAPKVHENAKEALALCNSGHLYSIHTTREPSKTLILGVEIACRLLGH